MAGNDGLVDPLIFQQLVQQVKDYAMFVLDPAGRICVVDARRVILFFPQGFIPPKIRDLMPVDRSDNRPE